MLSRFAQKHIFMTSGFYFWSLGSQKYAQERPGKPFKVPKASILNPPNHQKSIKSAHWTSKVTPGTPKAPKIDEKVTPDTSRNSNITKNHTEINDQLMEKCITDCINTHAVNWAHHCRQTSKKQSISPSVSQTQNIFEVRRCRARRSQ